MRLIKVHASMNLALTCHGEFVATALDLVKIPDKVLLPLTWERATLMVLTPTVLQPKGQTPLTST